VRNLTPLRPGQCRRYSILLKCCPLVIFGLCAMLFGHANPPSLPLVGQKLAVAYPREAPAMMSACTVAAQLVMLPIWLNLRRLRLKRRSVPAKWNAVLAA
jgi:hypothetical protein